jgi:hypothetical protein
MQIRNRILGIGMAAIVFAGFLAAPSIANADQRHRRSSDDTRAKATVLGALGIILVANKQEKLGAIALGAAALTAASGDRRNHDRWYDNRRHDRDYVIIVRDSCDRYRRDRRHVCNDDCFSRYDRDRSGRNDRNDRDRYDRNDRDRYDRDRRDRDRYDRDDCEDDRRGRDWAATRGKKKGWDKNGKRR